MDIAPRSILFLSMPMMRALCAAMRAPVAAGWAASPSNLTQCMQRRSLASVSDVVMPPCSSGRAQPAAVGPFAAPPLRRRSAHVALGPHPTRAIAAQPSSARPQPLFEIEGLRCKHRTRLLDHLAILAAGAIMRSVLRWSATKPTSRLCFARCALTLVSRRTKRSSRLLVSFTL